ncbi:MAG: cytochrome ubiquinol oxidase subunit I [Thermoleophilaceae bacterium]|nr:cytochrome ubiquinol oxidase subunit I [Thermoleophilaceae bacterium]
MATVPIVDVVLAAVDPVRGALGQTDQEHLLPARQMQALSFIVHIPIVCFGIAFPAMFLFVEGLWLRTGNPVYKALAKRWSKIALVLFAVGVVTGTILSFEFGLLWPNFTATFGEVFGLAFALEGISFFVEAIFIAIYVYGWDRISRRAHFLVGIPVVIAGLTGSLTVLTVNGWMNDPRGFDLVNGKVVNPQPFTALFGGNVWHELVHMYLAGYMVVGFLVAGYYGRRWLKGRRDHYTRTAMIVGLTFAALVAPVQVVVGDWAARTVAEKQPVKLASFEGLGKTTKGAPFHLGGYYSDGEIRYGIAVPKLLSLLAFHDPNATVKGVETVPEADRPPVNVVRTSFMVMISVGSALMALGLWFLVLWWRRGRLPRSPWFYRALMAAGPLALLALICGWITTEVGRQPWVVYKYMRTEQAVTDADGLWLAFGVMVVVYAALVAATVWLLRRLASTSAADEIPEHG